MKTKRCSTCGVTKDISEFSKNRSIKSGLRSECKACQKKYREEHKPEIAVYNKQWNLEYKEEVAAYKKQWNLEHKKERAAYDKQYRQNYKTEIAAKEKQYRWSHKAEKAIYDKRYRQVNKIKIAEWMKQYYQNDAGKNLKRKKNHKRRALKLNATVDDFSPAEIFERDGYICQLCGRKTRPDYKNPNHPLYPDLDHIVPLSKRGENTKRNTQCLCHQCNLEKNSKIMGQLKLFG